MSLIAHNMTTSPVTLTGTSVVLPAATAVGARGRGVNVTAELLAFTAPQFAALQLQANPSPGTPSPLVVQYEWDNGPQEFPTPGLSVSAASFVAADDFLIWAGPAGVAGAPGTPTNPTTIDDAHARMPSFHMKRCQLLILVGTHSPLWNAFKVSQQLGSASSPFVMIGDFTNEVGDVVSSAAEANGRSITGSNATMLAQIAVSSTLTDNPLSAVATTVNVASTTGFPDTGFLLIDTEIIGYAAKTATSFTGCQRGAGVGNAVAHLVGATVAVSDRYRGYFIDIIVAGAVQQRRMVTFNDAAGVFSVNQKFSPVPSAGATFRIIAPSAIVNAPVGGGLFISYLRVFGMKGLWFKQSATAGMNWPDGSLCFNTEGCWFTGVSVANRPQVVVARGALLRPSFGPTSWTSDGANNPFSASRAAAGGYWHYMLLAIQQARMENAVCIYDSVNLSVTEGATLNAASPFARFTTFSIARAATLTGISNDTSANPITTVMDVGDGAANQILQLTNVSATRNITGALQLNNSQVSAILISTGAYLQDLGSNSATLNITGSGSLRYGVEIATGGIFRLLNQGITLAGVLGELKVGQKPAMTWAQFRSRYPLASVTNNVAADFVPGAPVKRAFTGLVAADSFDITTLGVAPFASPALVVGALRVVAATLNTGPYLCTDVGGTPFASAGGAFGVATISDDGKTITFPAGTLATDFTIEYVPCDPVSVSGGIAINNSV